MKKIFKMAAFMLALGSMTAGFTACSDDDDENTGTIDEQISFDKLNVVAQSNGQVLIDGEVTANTKIKSLVLATDAEGSSVVVDLLKSGDQTKAKEINDAGEKEKTFTLSIPTTAVDVQTLYLVGKTKGDKKASSAITETIEYKIGAANSTTASYLSITENKSYDIDRAKENVSTIEVIANSSSDGNTVEGIKRASEARSADINQSCGKVALFQNGSDTKVVTDGGVIITEKGAICKVVKIEQDASSTDATFQGITIKSGLGAIKKVDVSAFTFSK